MKRTILALAGTALLLAGCSSGGDDARPSSSATTFSNPGQMLGSSPTAQATSPADRKYESAYSLAADLSAHGIECVLTPGQSVGSSVGSCEVPAAGGGNAIHLSLTVWPTPAKATAGIAAVVNHAKVIHDISGDRSYMLSGTNWLIDFGIFGIAANTAKGAFGGEYIEVS